MSEQQYMTPEELSAYFGGNISVRTLANWRSQGISPPYRRIGGKILYPVKELKEWEQARTHTSTSTYTR